MLKYIVRRLIYLVILEFTLTILAFIVIQLPPGDYIDKLVSALSQQGVEVTDEQIESMRQRYGLDKPVIGQYFQWIGNIILRFDLGRSLQYNQPVAKLIKERLPLTMLVSFGSMLFVYCVAIPIGIYSATHQYSPVDYIITFGGFIGLATPNFLLALVLMFVAYKYFGWSVGGLFSPEYQVAPWSLAKVFDLLKHLPIPIIVVGTAGTAGMIRVMRATLLDELRKQYVVTARSKGVSERRLLIKYPVRMAINPQVASIGGVLPGLISGSAITAIVISLPTIGPLLLSSVLAQDMHVAATLGLILGTLGLLGVLISDLLLVVVDPRIRLERGIAR